MAALDYSSVALASRTRSARDRCSPRIPNCVSSPGRSRQPRCGCWLLVVVQSASPWPSAIAAVISGCPSRTSPARRSITRCGRSFTTRCHNLVFRWRNGNRWVAIVANFPLVVPGAISFGKYHLLHHRHMGDLEFDAGFRARPKRGHRALARRESDVDRGTFRSGIVRPSRMNKIACSTAGRCEHRDQVASTAGCVARRLRRRSYSPSRASSRSGSTRSARGGSRSTSRWHPSRRPTRTTGR